MAKLHQICMHVASGRSSVLIWQRCYKLCISGFVDDVMLSVTIMGSVVRHVYS